MSQHDLIMCNMILTMLESKILRIKIWKYAKWKLKNELKI